jgi:AcrR family transcriptional regulator
MATTAEALRSDTRARILDAAFGAVTSFGLSRFTMEDVARLAEISRQTVYRYFDSKDALVMELVYREEDSFIEGVYAAYAAHDDLEEAMEEAILFCLRAARTHPLIDRLLAAEPEVLLPYLTTRGGGVVARAREAMEDLVAGRVDAPAELVRRIADIAARTIVSYTISPSEDRPEAVAREMARILSAAVGGLQTPKEGTP